MLFLINLQSLREWISGLNMSLGSQGGEKFIFLEPDEHCTD